MLLTYRYRVKDGSTRRHLRRHAGAVNYVWNYLCQIQRQAQLRRYGDCRVRWPSAFDLIKLTTGCAADLGLHSDTVAGICRQFVASRDAVRRCPRWRSAKKGALGWIPFNTVRAIRIEGAVVTYRKRRFHFWNSRELPADAKIRTGSFACDAQGRWYLNLQIEVPERQDCGTGRVGIDLGLKDLAALSDGTKIENPCLFRLYEQKLAVAQRAGNKARARAIQAKIANARKHFLHEHSTKLVRENQMIVVGNVNAKAMMQTTMAKSVADASWSMFRNMLRYKAVKHGARFEEADERYTSQTCSACGSRSGPKGIAGLRVRQWECGDCGVVHDRDTNASLNLLAGAERRPPAVEIPVL
jgi:putative transposase